MDNGRDVALSATPQDWTPDIAAQRAGEHGEISAQDALEILGVEVGDDPNCMHSDNDFVVGGEHPHFQHLRTEREGFAKVFVCRSTISDFVWKLRCEKADLRDPVGQGWESLTQSQIAAVSSCRHEPGRGSFRSTDQLLATNTHGDQVGLVLALERSDGAHDAETGEETVPGGASLRPGRSHLAGDRVVVRRMEKGFCPDWCGLPVVGDHIVSVDGETVHEMGISAGMQRQRTAAREAVRNHQSGRESSLGVKAMLACRARLTGTQGTFCWLGVYRPREVLAQHPVVISERYLPAFSPHLRTQPPGDDGGQRFEVRLLRGTPNYLEQVHTVDWEAYLRSLEVHEEARRMEKGLVPQLLAAGAAGDNAALESLVGERADPDWANEVGTTALHMAALNGHAGTAALLVTLKANVNMVDVFEASPIQKAARRGHQEVVDTLVLVKADVNHVDMWESNAMHWAAAGLKGRRAQAHLELLEGFGANSKQKNVDGLNPQRVREAGVARGYLWGQRDRMTAGTEGAAVESEGSDQTERPDEAEAGEGRGETGLREAEMEAERERAVATRPVRHLLAAVGITDTSAEG